MLKLLQVQKKKTYKKDKFSLHNKSFNYFKQAASVVCMERSLYVLFGLPSNFPLEKLDDKHLVYQKFTLKVETRINK